MAGGKGLRMGGETPKQFLPVGGKPVLMRTLERFRKYSAELRIVLVLPKAQQDYWRSLCEEQSFAVEHTVADGGETRFHSVRNGLTATDAGKGDIVGVHDGVRPFVGLEVIRRCYAAACASGAAIPVMPVVETLRHIGAERPVGNVPRSDYRLVQTPQVFAAPLLKRAYALPYTEAFTDDASVVEALGETVAMVEGNPENIKITTPFDLKVAEAILQG